jgi:putative copper export protein
MTPDSVSFLLRGLLFLALCQALGGVLFLAWPGAALVATRARLRSLAGWSVAVAATLLLVQASIDAARLAGEWSGLLDADMQRMAFGSGAGKVLAVRACALVLAVLALVLPRKAPDAAAAAPSTTATGTALAVLAVLAGAASFAFTGHTVQLAMRPLGAGLLGLHLALVLAWVGALQPLRIVALHEPASIAHEVVARFSRVATWLVPVLPVAGVLLAAFLLPGPAALATPYGLLLLAKFGGLCLAFVLAALNRSVHGPELATGGEPARRRFAGAVLLEGVLLAGVLVATAAMTGFY